MVPQPPSQPRGTRHGCRLDSHHDRPHRHRRGEGRALAPDHLDSWRIRPLPGAHREADSGGHPRPQVAAVGLVLLTFTAAALTAEGTFSRTIRAGGARLDPGRQARLEPPRSRRAHPYRGQHARPRLRYGCRGTLAHRGWCAAVLVGGGFAFMHSTLQTWATEV